jgi:NADH:ubiquinone oxidoreductase subunit D
VFLLPSQAMRAAPCVGFLHRGCNVKTRRQHIYKQNMPCYANGTYCLTAVGVASVTVQEAHVAAAYGTGASRAGGCCYYSNNIILAGRLAVQLTLP